MLTESLFADECEPFFNSIGGIADMGSIHFGSGAIWRVVIEHRGIERSCTGIVYCLRHSP